jgi:hypothetical protein
MRDLESKVGASHGGLLALAKPPHRPVEEVFRRFGEAHPQ